MSHDLLNHFYCWSLSAKDGDPAALRERATIKQLHRIQTLNTWLDSSDDQEGLFYLATCHRVELYAWTKNPSRFHSFWLEACCSDEAQKKEMQSSLSYFQGANTLSHLIKVCAGLESEVLGETQILGQVKDAVREAKENTLLRGPIDRATQMSFRVAKKIRTQTKIGEGTVSIAHAAVEGLSDVFEDFKDKKILIVGAGTMAFQALEKFWSLGAHNITWINRSLNKILSSPWSTKVDCKPLNALGEEVQNAHITVLATRVEEPLLSRETLGKPQKKLGLQIVLDLGLPRNAHENIHGYGSFILRNVDEFSDRSLKGHQQRAQAVPEALEILEQELELCLKDWNHYSLAPARKELMLNMQQLKAETIDDLKLENESNLEYVIHSIYGKLSHRLLHELEQVHDDDIAGRLLELINRAWRRPQTNGSQKETQQSFCRQNQIDDSKNIKQS